MALAGQHKLSEEEETNNKYSDLLSQIPNLLAQVEQYVLSPDNSNDISSSPNLSNSKPYVSCIKINGVPILPPILDEAEKEEMRQYRDEAVKRMQQRNRSKQLLTDSSASINYSSVAENSSNPLLEQVRTVSLYDNIPGSIPKDKSSDSFQQSSFPEEELVPQVSYQLVPPKNEISFQENREETSLSSPTSKLKYCDNLLITSSLSDLGSLEEGSLPTEMNGIPLTSRCEQQIIKDLSTLIKHLPENCSSGNSDFSDFNSESNFDLICNFSDLDKENPHITKLASDEPEMCSFLSNIKPNITDSSLHLSNNKSHNVLKAPIFLTNENGLELHALPAENKHSMKTSVNKEQGWIINSPLIAYVTKKRPKTVGMSSNLPQKPIKIQQIGNATFTIDTKAVGKENHLVRPVISGNQDSHVANVCQVDSTNNSISPKSKLKEFCKLNQSYNNSVEVHTSNQEQITTNHLTTNLVLPESLNSSHNLSKGENSTIDVCLSESKLEDIEHEKVFPFSSSTHDLSIKDHMSDDSLDELLFGIDKIGFVPRKDGDGSDWKDLNNPVKSGVVNKKCNFQRSDKSQTFSPTELIQANFTPVRTHSYHNLQVSTAATAMTDITNSSEVCSLAEVYTSDPTANHLILTEEMIKTSPSRDMNLIPKYSADPVIRRGSYTLMEPSVDLRKYFNNSLHHSHGDKDDDDNTNSSCSVSDKIPTYEDFETQLQKKNSENVSPLSIKSDMDSFKSEQQSSKGIEVKNTSNNSVQHSSPFTKEKIPRNFILETTPLSAASCQSECSTLNASRKRSPIENKDDKCNINSSASYPTQNSLEASAFKDNIHSSNSPGQSAVLTSNELFDWEDIIEDELRLFFSEKRQSFMKMQQQFKEYEEQFEDEYQRTLDSMQISQRWPKELTSDINILIPKTNMTSSKTREQALLNHQLISSTSQRKLYRLVKTDQDPASIISAAVKGYLTRKLLSCPKVESLKKTINECLKLLEETIDSSNLNLITRLNNQLDAARIDIHDIFFEMTTQERMNIIHQSRLLAAKKPQTKLQQISSATQKYLMRKNQINQIQNQSAPSSLSDKLNIRNNSKLHPIPFLVQPTKSTTRKISSQQIPKNRIVSVTGKMAATRFVSTKMKDVPSLKITSNKPWR